MQTLSAKHYTLALPNSHLAFLALASAEQNLLNFRAYRSQEHREFLLHLRACRFTHFYLTNFGSPCKLLTRSTPAAFSLPPRKGNLLTVNDVPSQSLITYMQKALLDGTKLTAGQETCKIPAVYSLGPCTGVLLFSKK